MSDPIRWDVSMTQDGIGRFVSYHDYAMKDEECERLRARVSELEAALAKREAVPDGMYLLPTQATADMQDTMRDALVDQGWCHDSASEVDFADIWYAGVNEYVTQQEDMLAASQQAKEGKP